MRRRSSRWLDQQASVAKNRKIGTQGYCMGGPMAFRTAAAVPDRVGAVASFHGGGLVTDAAEQPAPAGGEDARRSSSSRSPANDDKRSPNDKTVLKETFAQGEPAGGDRGLRRRRARLVPAGFRASTTSRRPRRPGAGCSRSTAKRWPERAALYRSPTRPARSSRRGIFLDAQLPGGTQRAGQDVAISFGEADVSGATHAAPPARHRQKSAPAHRRRTAA